MKRFSVLLIFYIVIVFFIADMNLLKSHFLSDEFIKLINNRRTTWRAGRNFGVGISVLYIEGLLGGFFAERIRQKRKLPFKRHAEDVDLPDSFDARKAWPECASVLDNIRDQSECGACWAFAAVAAMSDRICIHSNASQIVSVSAEDLIECCINCGDGCNGGYSEKAWSYWQDTGIVTGGDYNTLEGCKNYKAAPCDHHVVGTLPPCHGILSTPSCVKTCDNRTLNYEAYITRGTAYAITNSVKQIQLEILKNGPVESDLRVYSDFLTYKSGVYQSVEGDPEGMHAMKILGWGEENGVPYWLVANSWNKEWGDKGYIKILRGSNECEIEENVVAGLPTLFNSKIE